MIFRIIGWAGFNPSKLADGLHPSLLYCALYPKPPYLFWIGRLWVSYRVFMIRFTSSRGRLSFSAMVSGVAPNSKAIFMELRWASFCLRCASIFAFRSSFCLRCASIRDSWSFLFCSRLFSCLFLYSLISLFLDSSTRASVSSSRAISGSRASALSRYNKGRNLEGNSASSISMNWALVFITTFS